MEDIKFKELTRKLQEEYDEYHNVTLPLLRAKERAAQARHAEMLLLCCYTDWKDDNFCKKPATNRITLKPTELSVGTWPSDTKWRFFARSCDEHCQERVAQLKKGWQVIRITPFDPEESQEPKKVDEI